jgi:hypothetical protein
LLCYASKECVHSIIPLKIKLKPQKHDSASLSNAEIVKQLRTTADESTTYQKKWLSADNWIEHIKAQHTNPILNSNVLNAALSRNPSTKDVDVNNSASNQTGIDRNKKQENNRRICYYYYYSTVPRSDVDELL